MPRTNGRVKDGKAASTSCLECRLSKTRCEGASRSGSTNEDRTTCERCSRYGFHCQFLASGKRGPKPRSKVAIDTGTIVSLPESQATDVNILDDLELRRGIWTSIQKQAKMPGSNYTFVSQGKIALSENATSDASHASSSASRTTMRQLLRRVDDRSSWEGRQSTFDNTFTISTDEVWQLPLDNVQRDALAAYFDIHLLPWVCSFRSAQDILRSTTTPSTTFGRAFLLTVIMHLAAQFQGRQELASRARQLCVIAFATLQDDVDTLLAFDLLTVWKAPDDDFSERYAAYADHIAASLARIRRKDALTVRAQLFHYIQRSVFFLHVDEAAMVEAYSSDWTPTDWIDELLHHSPPHERLPLDWFVCADVESIVMQRRMKTSIISLANSQPSDGRGGLVFSHALLDHLLTLDTDLKIWERRWKRKATGNSTHAAQALTILGNSVRMQISSMVFKLTLAQIAAQEDDGSTAPSYRKKIELLNTSFGMCTESATKMLHVAQCVDARAMVHLTDSIVILINHAALITVYMCAIAAPISDFGHLIVDAQLVRALSTTSVESVRDLIRSTRDSMQRAAALVTGESVCQLSSEHLDSLHVVCQSTETAASAADIVGWTESSGDLNWLNSILFDFDPAHLSWSTGYHIAR